MQCLRNAILPKTYIAEMNDKHGWDIRHPCETSGIMEDLVLDRGAENVAKHVRRFAVRSGVNRVIVMGGKRPHLKGAVESVIGTLSERLLHPARGTTFHNTLQRMGYDPVKDAVCTTDDLDWALTKYFVDIYPREECRALNMRRRIDVWREKTREHPVEIIGDVSEIAHLFGRSGEATPGRQGINANAIQYYSRELQEARNDPRFQRALAKRGGKVEFHFDPADIGAITVRMPHEDRTIVVPASPQWRAYATGLSLYAHRKIREFNRAQSRASNKADQLLRSKAELYEIMGGSALSKRGSIRDRQTFARMEGRARRGRAGDDASTTVPGSPAHGRSEAPMPVASNDDQHAPRTITSPKRASTPPPSEEVAIGATTLKGEPSHDADEFTTTRSKKGYRP